MHLAGRDYKVPEVIGAVLSDIIARASRLADGDKPPNLVLTHPEAWGQVELERLIESAEAAGIERSRVETGPAARDRARTSGTGKADPADSHQRVPFLRQRRCDDGAADADGQQDDGAGPGFGAVGLPR